MPFPERRTPGLSEVRRDFLREARHLVLDLFMRLQAVVEVEHDLVDAGRFHQLQVLDDLRRRADQNERRAVAEQLVDALREKNPVEPPEPLVERDLDNRVRMLANSMMQGGVPAEQVRSELEQHLDTLRAECEKTVASTILVDALADQQGIETTEEAVEARLEAEASAAGKTPAALRAAMEKDGRLERIRTQLRRDAAIDFLRDRAELAPAQDQAP